MQWLDPIRDVLIRLTPYLPSIIGTLIFTALILLGALWLLLKRSKQKAKDGEGEKDKRDAQALDALEPFQLEPDDLPLLPLKSSFRHALKLLKAHVSGRDWRYAIPWYLLIGPEDAGKSTLISSTELNLPVGAPAEDWEDVRPACKWWFFDHGVVLDIAGQLVRGHHGRASNRKGWSQLLRLLDHHRPRRPIDGVVLTIPLDDLLDQQGRPRTVDDVVQRAEALYKKLWQAQSQLGLAFPVYVVITKADRLTGFKPFVSELPHAMHGDILGWSCPYSFETEFRHSWVDEAIDRIEGSVRATQMEIFADREAIADAEGLFQLPAEIEKLRDPLDHAMHALFKASSYHEAFSLRGIYLTGDGGQPRPAGLRPMPVLPGVYSGPKEEIRPAFLHDLFEEKIFPESGLARPAKRALLARNRTALTAQIATAAVVLFGGVGLAWDYASVTDGVDSVHPFIEEVHRDIREEKALRQAALESGEARAHGSFDRGKALSLLNGMSRVDADSFDSLFMPTSWVSTVDQDVVAVTTEAFDRFILQTTRTALQQRAEEILTRPFDRMLVSEAARTVTQAALSARVHQAVQQVAGGSGQASSAVAPPVDRGEAYQRIETFALAVRQFENAIGRYNGLRETRDLKHIKWLVAYLFDVVLPDTFLENSGFYEAALTGVAYSPIELRSYRDRTLSRFQTLLDEELPRLFTENPLILELEDLERGLSAAANRRLGGLSLLQEVRQRIASTREMFDEPRFEWMERPDFDPAVSYSDVMERIAGLSLLGPPAAERFLHHSREGAEAVRERIAALRVPSVGPLLEQDGERTELRFSQPILDFNGVLETLFARPFMTGDRLRPLPPAPPTGVPALWEMAPLDEATGYLSVFSDFTEDRLLDAPNALRPVVRQAAAERLADAVNDRIANALSVGEDGRTAGLRKEEALRREVSSFTAASSPLTRILATYDDLALEESYLDLSDLVMGHAVGLMQEADELFAEEAFYEPQGGDFRWWQGDARMALDAYRARDRFELLDILARQRERIAIIAGDYVRPLTTFIDGQDIRMPQAAERLVSKWRRIGDELEKYNLRRADNSVSELEGFITGAMMEITFATCSETLGEAGLDDGQAGGDFFLARMGRLERGIRQRCADLAGVQAQVSYDEIRARFQERLAGRYPFVAGGYSPDMAEASPRDLAAFFALYDREAEPARRALTQATDLGFARDRALDFLDRMDQVRRLFDPWLSAGAADDAPVFDVSASFRVNRDREAGANQVIEWALTVGPTRLDQRSGSDATARWSLGEPVALLLRWAENSTAVPAAVPERQDLTVDGRRVTISYDNIWSLFELIRRQRAGSDDFERFVDPRPHTLRVDLPTRPEGGGPIDQARLFARVELSARGAGEPVDVVVPIFPASAPDIAE